LALGTSAAACSSSGKASSTTPATSTTAPPVPTDAPTTTIVSATTSTAVATTTTAVPTTTTEAPTTTTVPPGSLLPLRADGIGDARFGADPDDVVKYITTVLGPFTGDSGWVDAPSRECPGTEVRYVAWGDLNLIFSDSSKYATGRRHFFTWAYGPPEGVAIVPAAMTTLDGIGIGSTVAQLKAKYPAARVFAGDAAGTGSSTLTADLYAFMNGADDNSVIVGMLGGEPCNIVPTTTTESASSADTAVSTAVTG
jgi:hypothetical protein